MLVARVRRPRARSARSTATPIAERYRFFSYGDAMLLRDAARESAACVARIAAIRSAAATIAAHACSSSCSPARAWRGAAA